LIRAAGHYEAIGNVVVEAKRRSEITLYPEPRNRSKQDEGSNASAGWAAIGVGGLLVAGGVYSSVKVKAIEEDPAMQSYRAQFAKGQNACTEAERGTERPGAAAPGEVADLCSEARTYQALQYLLFGLGSVAVGTGALILLTDSPGGGRMLSSSRGSPCCSTRSAAAFSNASSSRCPTCRTSCRSSSWPA
jgi:hypothetical protein